MLALVTPWRGIAVLGLWLALGPVTAAQIATPRWGADAETVVATAPSGAGLRTIDPPAVSGEHVYLLARRIEPGDGLSLTASYGFGTLSGELEIVALYLDVGDPAVLLDRLEATYGSGVVGRGPTLAGSALVYVVRFIDTGDQTLVTFDLKGEDCYVIYLPLPPG